MRLLVLARLASVSLASLLLACGSDEASPAQAGGTPNGPAAGAAGATAAGGSASTAGGAGGMSEPIGGAPGAAGAGGGEKPPTGAAMSLTVGGARSTQLHVPASYDAATPMPLVVLLHGYTASGAVQETYLQLQKQADAQGFLYVHPDGTLDASKNRFWNATDACCDFQGTNVDDEGYLMGLIDEIESKVSVDKKRVFFFGHSNGGFMAYRMACNHADRIAGVGVLAGAMVKDATACKPTAPVSVLHVHGTADATIAYKGGTVALGVPGYPGAEASIAQWVAHDACAPQGIASGTADYESKLPGEETSFTSYGGCQAGAAVELWTLDKGGHIPAFTKEFAPAAMKWLLSHPKP